MKIFFQAIGGLIVVGFLSVLFFFLSWGCSYLNDATRTTFNETKASTLVKRYSWFKDAAARLDSFKADIEVYEGRFQRLKNAYDGQQRLKWSREDREQSNLWEQEVAGIKSGYNALASEYNSAMAKINWAFCNVGELPAGGVPLPREFRVYETR